MCAYGEISLYKDHYYRGSEEFNYETVIEMMKKIIDKIGIQKTLDMESRAIIDVLLMFVNNQQLIKNNGEPHICSMVAPSEIYQAIVQKLLEYDNLKELYLDMEVEMGRPEKYIK
jgi:hypothetical protein